MSFKEKDSEAAVLMEKREGRSAETPSLNALRAKAKPTFSHFAARAVRGNQKSAAKEPQAKNSHYSRAEGECWNVRST